MVSVMADLVSISEAADALGLSSARIRLLAATGDLEAEKIGGRWLVERGAVERRRAHRSAGGRPFAPHNAWAVLGLASGDEAVDVDPRARSRLRRILSLEGLGALAPRLVGRAAVGRYAGHPGEIGHLLKNPGVVRSGVSAAREVGLDLVSGREADGYVRASKVSELVGEHALMSAKPGEANVTLRAVPDDAWGDLLEAASHAPEAAVALDLAEDLDPRSRAAGKDLLARLDRDR